MKRLAVLVLFIALISCGTNGRVTPAATSPAAGSGTVHGRVTAGPTCPVQRSDSPCPENPVAATVTATRDGSVIATTVSGADGGYSFDLAAGAYTLHASTGKAFPRPASVDVIVFAGRSVTANISMDTGIR